jgi:hypothetical protein
MVLNASNFPWANITQICAKRGVYIDNYPDVPIPSNKDGGQHSKGIGNIKKHQQRLLIDALHAEIHPLQFVKHKNMSGMFCRCFHCYFGI